MPLAPAVIAAIIDGGASIAGGALANHAGQTSSISPTIDPAYQGLQGQILNMIQGRLKSDPNLTGYAGTGVSQINQGFNTIGQTQENDLTRRGLATSPIAATVDATRNNARVGAITSFRNSIPLLSRQLQGEDLAMGNSILAGGRGSTSTGTQSAGGGAAGAFSNLAGYLGYLQGKGLFGNSRTPAAAIPGTDGGY